MTRTLGLDVGTKTVGVALSDALGWTAQGLTTLKIDSENGHFGIDEVVKITEENDVSTIVVGLPKHMNNSIGESGERSIHYSKLLENSMPDVKILLWDERLSTAVPKGRCLKLTSPAKNGKL